MRKMRFVGVRFIVFGVVALGITGLVVVSLWNLLIPSIFGLRAINFWEALGLFFLSRALFGRLGGWGPRMAKSRFVRGWKDLSPEERQRFRHAMDPARPASEAKIESE